MRILEDEAVSDGNQFQLCLSVLFRKNTLNFHDKPHNQKSISSRESETKKYSIMKPNIGHKVGGVANL